MGEYPDYALHQIENLTYCTDLKQAKAMANSEYFMDFETTVKFSAEHKALVTEGQVRKCLLRIKDKAAEILFHQQGCSFRTEAWEPEAFAERWMQYQKTGARKVLKEPWQVVRKDELSNLRRVLQEAGKIASGQVKLKSSVGSSRGRKTSIKPTKPASNFKWGQKPSVGQRQQGQKRPSSNVPQGGLKQGKQQKTERNVWGQRAPQRQARSQPQAQRQVRPQPQAPVQRPVSQPQAPMQRQVRSQPQAPVQPRQEPPRPQRPQQYVAPHRRSNSITRTSTYMGAHGPQSIRGSRSQSRDSSRGQQQQQTRRSTSRDSHRRPQRPVARERPMSAQPMGRNQSIPINNQSQSVYQNQPVATPVVPVNTAACSVLITNLPPTVSKAQFTMLLQQNRIPPPVAMGKDRQQNLVWCTFSHPQYSAYLLNANLWIQGMKLNVVSPSNAI